MNGVLNYKGNYQATLIRLKNMDQKGSLKSRRKLHVLMETLKPVKLRVSSDLE